MTDFQFVNTDNYHDQDEALLPSPRSLLLNENRYFCAICDRKLNDIHLTDDELTERFKTPNGFNCNVCYQVYRSLKMLKEHQMDHFKEKDFKVACVECTNVSKTFDTDGTLDEMYTKNELSCEICDRHFDQNNFLRHMRDHYDRLVYTCDHCEGIKIIGWERWNIHNNTAHKDIELMKKSASIGVIRLQNHLRQSSKFCNPIVFPGDNGEKKNYTFQCGKCKRKFSERSFKMHIDEGDCYKENHCTTCSKRFTRSSLVEHYLVGGCSKVGDTSKFDCTNCAKSFHTRKGFVLHSQVCLKSGKSKTDHCDICKLSVDSVANHWNDIHRLKSVVKVKRTTDIERTTTSSSKCSTAIQFGCLLCEDTFCDRQQLIRHMKIHYCDKAVQTVPEDQCEMSLGLIDSESKQLVTSNLKDEKLSPRGEIEDENKFPLSNEIIKSESVDNFEEMWTPNSDGFDDYADDIAGEITGDDTTATIQNNVRGMTSCCLCKTFIHDLVNTDDVVQQQIRTYGECICYICFHVFTRLEKLREHESSHFQENFDGHQIGCRRCAWSSNVYYSDGDFFRLEKDLQCYICSTKMSDIRTLRRHKRSHLSLCVFTCKVCNKKSISDERHRSHLRKHQKPEFTVVTNKIVRKCTICGDEATNLFRDEDEIDKMFEKFGGGPCKICFTYINDKRRYISHERSHMEDQQLVSCVKCCNTQHYTDDEYHKLEDELKCFICNAKLSSLYNLHLHKRKHLDRVVYSCSHCLALVVGTRNHSHHLYKHGLRKKNREEEVGQFICDYCQKVFPHKSSLPAHFKQHLNKERVPCNQCTLTFASKGNLTQHIKQIHLNIRKHICELCGKAFGHPHNLKSHMVKHSGEKPYQCPICLKRFGYYSRMKTHAWIHSGLKPYKCDQCDKCYNDSTDLRRHKRIHGGVEKKFECELCKIKFYEHKYLRAHRASAHKFLVQ